jgi:hypothetical protein
MHHYPNSLSPLRVFVPSWFICPALRASVVGFPFFPRLPLCYNETSAAPGAQCERPGLVGPVSVSLASVGSPAALLRMKDEG